MCVGDSQVVLSQIKLGQVKLGQVKLGQVRLGRSVSDTHLHFDAKKSEFRQLVVRHFGLRQNDIVLCQQGKALWTRQNSRRRGQ
jgi:hypothetical protein